MNKINTRNYGIDLARISAMIMVLILHILGHGGLRESYESLSGGSILVTFLSSLSIIAVNLFAIITGYVMLSGRWKISRLISLWFQVLFYSWTITSIFYFVGSTLSFTVLLQSFKSTIK